MRKSQLYLIGDSTLSRIATLFEILILGALLEVNTN